MSEDKFVVEYIVLCSLEYLENFTFLLSFTLQEIERKHVSSRLIFPRM